MSIPNESDFHHGLLEGGTAVSDAVLPRAATMPA